MNCPTCGAPVADGMSFCTQCGAQFNTQYQQPGMQYQQPQQPQQPQYQQPGMQYQQPQQPQYQQPGMQPQQPQYQQPQYQQPQQQYDPNMQYQQTNPGNAYGQQGFGSAPIGGSFIEAIKADPIKITTYVGFLFLFFTSWFPRWVKADGDGAGLFMAGGGILKFWGILLLLVAVWGLLVEFGSYIPALNSIADTYKKLPFSQFYVPAASLLIYLLCTFNGNIRLIVTWGKLVSKTGYGFCMWFCLLGVILITIRPVMALVKKQNYWTGAPL